MHKSLNAKILGVRLDERTLRDVKAEAGRRGMSVSDLFKEIWMSYRSTATKHS